LSVVAIDQGDAERAVERCEEGLTLFRELGDRGQIAHSLHLLGLATWLRGDERRAEALLEESLTVFREYGHKMPVAQVLASLGLVALDRGDDRRAEKAFAESLKIGGVGASRWLMARELEGMAGVAVDRGQPERAARLFGAAEGLRTAIGAPLAPAFRPLYEQHLAAARTELGEERFAEAWKEGRAMAIAPALALALERDPSSVP
jgi:tetratricopeptide (TPR) repeat protein